MLWKSPEREHRSSLHLHPTPSTISVPTPLSHVPQPPSRPLIGLPKLVQMLDEGAWLEVYDYSELEKRALTGGLLSLSEGPIGIRVIFEFDPSLALSQSCKVPPRSKKKMGLGHEKYYVPWMTLVLFVH